MAGKFSLLTTLTLSAAGYNSGLDQAKQKTKDFAKGTEAAANSVKSSFSGLAGLLTPLTSSMGTLPSSVMAGVSAFKLMLPAINSISVALISTGIGALVVALGVAFAALTSYLTSTSEGANKLKVIFSYVSGAVTELMNRVKYLGSALFSLLTGDIEGFKKSIKEAFASGFFDQVKKSAEESQAITIAQIALDKEKRDISYQHAKNLVRVAELTEIAKNKDVETNETLKERLGAARELRNIQLEENTALTALAQKQYELDERTNKQKAFLNKEDKDRVLDSYTAWKTAEANKFNDLTSGNAIIAKIQKQQKAEDRANFQDEKEQLKITSDLASANTLLEMENAKDLAKTKKEEKLIEIEDWRRTEIDKIKAIKATTDLEIAEQKRLIDRTNAIAATKVTKASTDDNLEKTGDNLNNEQDKLNTKLDLNERFFKVNLINEKDYNNTKDQLLKDQIENEKNILKNKYDQGIIDEQKYNDELLKISEKVANDKTILDKERADKLKKQNIDNLSAMSSGYGDMASASQTFFGEQSAQYKAFAIAQASISTYLAAANILANTSKLGPVAMWTAFAGTIAVGLANVAKIAGFQNGGIVGGSSYSGDKVLIRVNSGEGIVTRKGINNINSMFNNGNSSNEVEFKIKGDMLVGVINNYNKIQGNRR